MQAYSPRTVLSTWYKALGVIWVPMIPLKRRGTVVSVSKAKQTTGHSPLSRRVVKSHSDFSDLPFALSVQTFQYREVDHVSPLAQQAKHGRRFLCHLNHVEAQPLFVLLLIGELNFGRQAFLWTHLQAPCTMLRAEAGQLWNSRSFKTQVIF